MALVDEGDEMMQEKQGANGQQRSVGWFKPECTGLRSLSPSLKIPEVGGPDLHLCKLNGMLMTLPVEPVYTLAMTVVSISAHYIHSMTVFIPESSLIRQSTVGDSYIVVIIVG